MSDDKNSRIKSLYIQLQVHQKEMEQLQEHLEDLEKKKWEAKYVIESLDELTASDGKSEILVPVSNGIFIQGSVSGINKLLVNVGAGCVVEKTVEETKQMVQSQVEEISKLQQRIERDLLKIADKASGIESDFLELQKEIEG